MKGWKIKLKSVVRKEHKGTNGKRRKEIRVWGSSEVSILATAPKESKTGEMDCRKSLKTYF